MNPRPPDNVPIGTHKHIVVTKELTLNLSPNQDEPFGQIDIDDIIKSYICNTKSYCISEMNIGAKCRTHYNHPIIVGLYIIRGRDVKHSHGYLFGVNNNNKHNIAIPDCWYSPSVYLEDKYFKLFKYDPDGAEATWDPTFITRLDSKPKHPCILSFYGIHAQRSLRKHAKIYFTIRFQIDVKIYTQDTDEINKLFI